MTKRKTRPQAPTDPPKPPDGFPTAEELRAAIPRLPAVADRLRLATLGRADTLGAAREQALAREEARREARFGEGSPEALAVAARVDVERRRGIQRRETVRLTEIGLELEPENVVILGRITDPQDRPVAGLTVCFAPERSAGAYAPEAVTDDTGFYVLETDRETFDKLFDKKSTTLALAVTGEPLEDTHVETRPLGDPRLQLRRIDIRLPEQVEGHAPPYPPVGGKGRKPKKRGKKKKAKRAEPSAEDSGQPEIPVTDVPGVGKVFASRLGDRDITTARQVADMSRAQLATTLKISQSRADTLRRNARTTAGVEDG